MIKFFSLYRSGNNLPYRPVDRILDIIGIIFTLLYIGVCIYFYYSSDAQVPVGFDSAGNPRDWGGKGVYLYSAGVGVIIWISCFFAARNPKYINLPVMIRPDRAVVQNYWKCHYCRWLLLACLLLFLSMLLEMRCAQAGMECGCYRFGFCISLVLVLVILVVMCLHVQRAGRV